MILIHLLLLVGGMYYFIKRTEVTDKFLFWSAWIFRLAMGIAVGLVYTYYYKANDTWQFFEDAKILSALARNSWSDYLNFLFTENSGDPVWQALFYTQERSVFLVKFISVLALINGDSYWISALYFSTVSFLAAWQLFTTVIRYFENAKLPAALAFLFFPSVVFWSSGLVKETLALAGIFWMSTIFLKFLKGDKISVLHFIMSLLALWVTWNLKYYWAALFLVVVVTSVIVHLLQKITSAKSFWWLMWGVLFVLICTIASQFHPNFYFGRFLEVVATNHNAFVQISKPEGLIHFYKLDASWWSMVINSPWALFSGLFRPWLGEANGFTSVLAAFENLLLLILLLSTCFRKSCRTIYPVLLTALIVYVALLCILLALSTPNLGTLSRYRVGFLPFFVFVIAYGNPLIEKIRQSTWHRHT